MTLFCPKCGRPIPVEDVNLATALARCRACNNLFNVSSILPQTPPPAAAAPDPRTQPILSVPRRFHMTEFAGNLTIHWRWFNPIYFFLAFFCVAWDSFLVFWYSMALTSHDAPWIMIIFPVAHVAVGVGLTYATLCGFLNATTLTISHDALSIRHGPLPWSGNRTHPAAAIRPIHCEQSRSTSRDSGTTYTYNLFATLTDGQKLKLLSGFSDPSEPRLLEQKIESHLRIPNQHVVGEYRG
jgi:hypothetical protein